MSSTPQPPGSASTKVGEDANVDLFKSTINEYLDNLPETVHQQLFQSRETCLAIFRLLPALSKFYIMSLLFHDTSVPYSDLNRWVKSNKNDVKGHQNPTKIYQNDSLKRLKSLHILKEIKRQMIHPVTKQPTIILFVQLNEIFRQSFRDALTGFLPDSAQDQTNLTIALPTVGSGNKNDASSNIKTMFDDDADNNITIEYLDRYCLNKWENILHFMVGTEVKDIPSVGVLTLLRFAGLMELPSDRERRDLMNGTIDDDIDYDAYADVEKKPLHVLRQLMITKNGFQFLLQEISSQIWTLLIQYLIMAEKLQMNPVDVLNFIFLLGSLELGQGYAIENLSKTQLIMLDDLQDYGLIYHEKDSSVFYPTRLATSLTSESSSFKNASTAIDQEIANPRADKATNNGAIIIETNFKIYCYTTSPLQIAILNIFCHLRARFFNLVTGVITRESVRSALRNGITSTQIINYLEAHAHSGMVELAEAEYNKKYEFESSIGNTQALEQLKLEILPPTVVDQIKLWQLELDRVQAFKGYLYKDFSNDFEFEKLLSYGEDIGVILWKDKTKRKFFVSREGNPQLIDYANKIIRSNSTPSRTGTPA